MQRRPLIAALTLVVSACAPKVDGSTAEKCRTSLDKVIAGASGSGDSARFAVSIERLTMGESLRSLRSTLGDALNANQTRSRLSVPEPAPDSAAHQATLCSALNRLSAGDIVERADALERSVTDSVNAHQDRTYLAALRAAHARASVARDSMSAFRIVRAAFTQRDGNVGLETAITITVQNGTRHAISGGFFSAVATTPGAAAPWLDQQFSYAPRGGIARGASATWRIVANRLTPPWGDVLIPRESQMVVTPLKLFSTSGEQLWGGAEFTKADQAALDRLAAKYK